MGDQDAQLPVLEAEPAIEETAVDADPESGGTEPGSGMLRFTRS